MYLGSKATDRCGYTLPHLTKEEAAARNAMISSEATKAQNWTTPDVSAFSQKKLKQLVREGIPANLRPQVWLQLSGGAGMRAEHAHDYFASLSARAAPKAFAVDVEAAILRHLPAHQFLASSSGVQSVVCIVGAFQEHTKRNLQQSTTCIAAFLVSVVGLGREEDCFWIMVGLLSRVLPADFPQEAAQGNSVELGILQELARKRCPKLCSAVATLDSSLLEVTAPWFSHLFCRILPAEVAVRVWDCLMCEGPKILFRVALALLKREETVVTGNFQKLRNMQWRISRNYNADALLKVAFKGIGSLPTSEITRARRSVEASVLQGKTQQAKRLEALLCPPRLSPQPSTSSAASELSTIVEGPESSVTRSRTAEDRASADLSAFQQRLSPLRV